MRKDTGVSRRSSYDETDISVLVSDPRFLVAADAYGDGCCTMAQFLRLAFEGPPYLPRRLSSDAFADLILEVVRRIHSGELIIADTFKNTYRNFYRQQEPDPQ
jgi:hypothetical protein